MPTHVVLKPIGYGICEDAVRPFGVLLWIELSVVPFPRPQGPRLGRSSARRADRVQEEWICRFKVSLSLLYGPTLSYTVL